MARAKFKCPQIWLGVALLWSAATPCAADPISEDAFNRCRTISDEMARLHCFESLTSPGPRLAPALPQTAPFDGQKPQDNPFGATISPQTAPSSSSIAGKWRLVHTPTPQDKRDIVSIMAPAELAGSDIDFAGVALRCAEHDFDIFVVLVRPLPPRTNPVVALGATDFQGSVVSPGTSIQLPAAATVLAKEQWRALQSVPIVVKDGDRPIHGLVSLEGFNTALQSLATTCLAQ